MTNPPFSFPRAQPTREPINITRPPPPRRSNPMTGCPILRRLKGGAFRLQLQASKTYPFAARSRLGPAFARSCEFIAGCTVTRALNARNHGSATAGNSEESFMSKTINPPRSPFSATKYAASGFISSRIRLILSLASACLCPPQACGLYTPCIRNRHRPNPGFPGIAILPNGVFEFASR